MKGFILCSDSSVRKHLREHFPEFTVTDVLPSEGETPDILIRWGISAGDDRARIVINRKQAIENARSGLRMLGLLRLNGIRHIRNSGGTSSSSIRRRYRAYIFDLRILALYRKQGKSYRKISPDLNNEVIEKVKSTAARAAYNLGLHIAMVEVGMLNEWRTVTISINPAPRLTSNLAQSYANAIRSYLSRQGALSAENILPFLRGDIILGADPEFMLRNRRTGRMVPASRLFPKAGPIGCDNRPLRGSARLFPLAEVRPQPTTNPIELIKNIRICLRRACSLATPRELKATRWEAGSMPFRGFPIGGHIHFSNVDLSSDLLRALDNYLAIPTMLIERNTTAIQRRRKYGHLGDHRVKAHGGFEYRTLGSWLMSPKIATAVLCLAKLVATEYRNLKSNYLDSFSSQKAFYSCDKTFFQQVFASLWSELASTPMYSHYSTELEVLKELVYDNKRWKESVDIKRTWNLT